jgi:hypothetical protein
VMWVHCTLYEQKEKTEEGPVGQLFTSWTRYIIDRVATCRPAVFTAAFSSFLWRRLKRLEEGIGEILYSGSVTSEVPYRRTN